MNKKFLIVLLAITPFLSQAQFGNILKKVKNKVDQRIEGKTDKAIDKTLDGMEGKPTPNTTPATGNTTTDNTTTGKETTATATPETIKSFSRFDFIPGEKILYTEDFAPDAIGELPLTWNASGKGEVMTLNKQQGKWLRVFQNNTYLTGNRKSFGENYTIEFDLMYFFEPKVKGYVLPGWSFGLFTSDGIDPSDNRFLKDHAENNCIEVDFGFGSYAMAKAVSRLKRQITFSSDLLQLGAPTQHFNQAVHYAIQVQKSRMRVWINETKVFDVPRAINTTDTLNQLFFKMEGSNYKDDEIGLFLSNIKVATGLPDTRHKLLEEGKFSTTGILFDFQSAVIKPESYGVIKEIAQVLKEAPTLKVNIIGHTSNDGDARANLELSKQRAAAVKQVMMAAYGIEETRLQTDGKGGTQPVADNKTPESKAQNRRVEFIKL